MDKLPNLPAEVDPQSETFKDENLGDRPKKAVPKGYVIIPRQYTEPLLAYPVAFQLVSYLYQRAWFGHESGLISTRDQKAHVVTRGQYPVDCETLAAALDRTVDQVRRAIKVAKRLVGIKAVCLRKNNRTSGLLFSLPLPPSQNPSQLWPTPRELLDKKDLWTKNYRPKTRTLCREVNREIKNKTPPPSNAANTTSRACDLSEPRAGEGKEFWETDSDRALTLCPPADLCESINQSFATTHPCADSPSPAPSPCRLPEGVLKAISAAGLDTPATEALSRFQDGLAVVGEAETVRRLNQIASNPIMRAETRSANRIFGSMAEVRKHARDRRAKVVVVVENLRRGGKSADVALGKLVQQIPRITADHAQVTTQAWTEWLACEVYLVYRDDVYCYGFARHADDALLRRFGF